ncbi:PIN domain-containing protein [Chryseobacterium sp. 2TAF14]|uniref:PIN domain-containing protein n=1 Tax=Chryseobacterium sp. 2TAF14 TaxID=3233007 RepID=UPI003F9229B4
MNIILDTNIFRADFFLKSKDFEVLFDYTEKTHSNIILLDIVLQEIEKLYDEELKEKYEAFKKVNFDLKKLLSEQNLELIEIDFEKQKKIFKENLLEKCQISDYNEVFKLDDSVFANIVKRAIYKEKPFKNNGTGFKDAILWESIIKYLQHNQYQDIIFISNNVKDFADENNKNKLHPFLVDEIKHLNPKIYYYSSVKDFIEKHSNSINSINSKWLVTNIDEKLYFEKIREAIEVFDTKKINDWFEIQNPNLKTTGKIKLDRVFFGKSENFYVYEMSSKELIINFNQDIEVELEIGFNKKNYYNSFTEGLVELNYIKLNLSVILEKNNNDINIAEIYFDIIE